MPLGAFLIAKPFQLAALCLDMRIGKSLPCRFALAPCVSDTVCPGGNSGA